MKNFYSNGKLLLTGEYLVLDGAKSLALTHKVRTRINVVETDSRAANWFGEVSRIQGHVGLKPFSSCPNCDW